MVEYAKVINRLWEDIMRRMIIGILIAGCIMMIGAALTAAETTGTLSLEKTTFNEGDPIMVTATGTGKDWVGLYLQGENPGDVDSIRWYYVADGGNTSGKAKNLRLAEGKNDSRKDYLDIPAGKYTVYLLANDGYEIISKENITVKKAKAGGEPALIAPESVYYEPSRPFEGAADGKLTINTLTTGEDPLPDSYLVYWADANGPLEDYTAWAPVMCTGNTTEYEVVANTLVPKNADRVIVYSVRGDKISDIGCEARIEKGSAADFGSPKFEIQVLSDIHLNTSDSHIHNQHFRMALADIGKVSPGSKGIFVNGDIADHGLAEEYDALHRLHAEAGDAVPAVYCSIGNHDLWEGPYESQLKQFLENTEPGKDKVYYDMWLEGTHFIFLGSEAVGLNAELSAEQLKWFRKTLAKDRDEGRPIFVFLHQGLIDTVAGTFAYQKWHGVNQTEEFSAILKDYPEIVLFSGHSHWEMDSAHCMKARDEALPAIFNTAAGAYLWNDASMATNVGIEGSQGYYIYVYSDKIVLRGRDFVNNKWIASAQFRIDLPEGSGEHGSASGAKRGLPAYAWALIGVGAAAAAACIAVFAVRSGRKKK